MMNLVGLFAGTAEIPEKHNIFIHLSIDKKLSHTISSIYPTGVNST